jgi:hypothetical protein
MKTYIALIGSIAMALATTAITLPSAADGLRKHGGGGAREGMPEGTPEGMREGMPEGIAAYTRAKAALAATAVRTGATTVATTGAIADLYR